SLKATLLSVLFLSIPLAYFGRLYGDLRRARIACAELRAAKATVVIDPERHAHNGAVGAAFARLFEDENYEDAVHVIATGNRAFLDNQMKHLKALPGLMGLYLSLTSVIDEGMQEVATLTGVTEVELSFTHITDRGLTSLAWIPIGPFRAKNRL